MNRALKNAERTEM